MQIQSICPYPACGSEISLDALDDELNKRGHVLSHCPVCKMTATFRSREAIEKLEASFQRRKEALIVEGGSLIAEPHGPQLSVLVEDIRSLWNVGSIFRTADGAGFSMVYLCGISGSPPRKEIEKVSLGAEKTVGWKYVVNPLEILDKLKKTKIQIMGLEASEKSRPLTQVIAEGGLGDSLCLVVGNEVSGLSPQVMNYCDLLCSLPMKGQKESLNVAVAFGIAAYQISESDKFR